MAAIDRAQLVEDSVFWLPDANTLTDVEITKIGEMIISQVGDDDTKYPEVLCKTLHACATKNLTESIISGGSIKKDETGDRVIEFFQGGVESSWKAYINSLSDICPLFGYNKSISIGMKISPGTAIDVFDGRLTDTSDLYL